MTRRPRIDDLTAIAVPEQPALSPDGTRVVYVMPVTFYALPTGERYLHHGLRATPKTG